MSSPLLAMLNGVYSAMGAQQEWAPLISDEQRSDSMRALFEGYYRSSGPDKVIFDTNRGWCAGVPRGPSGGGNMYAVPLFAEL